MFGHTGPFSYSPNFKGFSQEDLHQQRRPYLNDDLKGPPLQKNMFRPSGKSIYMQRKEYSEVLNKQSENFHVRVEHLFTCELDGQELETLDDCIAKLKRLDAKGRLWPQEMIMEDQGGYLLLTDIETQAELESLPLNHILQTTAVLDSCVYNSLLTVSVQEHMKGMPQVFMFQCEETGAELIKRDLDKAVNKGDGHVQPRGEQSDIRINLENILGHHALGSLRKPVASPVEREWTPPRPDHPPPQWSKGETVPQVYVPPHEMSHESTPQTPMTSERTDGERNKDIFNHVLNDLEIFLDNVSAAINAFSQQQSKGTKKKMFKKKKTMQDAISLPPCEEYIYCLQKIKYGFNLLAQLERGLTSPTAPEFVHIFFSALCMIVPQYPTDIPPAVVSPLLTVAALRLLSRTADPEEDQMWKSLGDSWNLPKQTLSGFTVGDITVRVERSRWRDDVPPYIPQFYDGWQPPTPSDMSFPPPYHSGQVSRSNSQHIPPDRPYPKESVSNSSWNSQLSTQPCEPPLYMRVIYDFMARNNHELSILKDDVVQVIQKSKQWWLVRNSHGAEGNIPQNVLEPMSSTAFMENVPSRRDAGGPLTLKMTSPPEEVKAWLQYKGFSRITVGTLGVLTGRLLLGMTKDEIRAVCPEEGGKVFFQLQAIKSAIALASEAPGLYNGGYGQFAY